MQPKNKKHDFSFITKMAHRCSSCKYSDCGHLGIKTYGQFKSKTQDFFFCCQCYPLVDHEGKVSDIDKDNACTKCKSNHFMCGLCTNRNCANLHWNTNQIVESDEGKIYICCQCYRHERNDEDRKIKPCLYCKENLSESEDDEPEKKRQKKEEMENLMNAVKNLGEEIKKIQDTLAEMREKKPVIKGNEGNKEEKKN